MPQCQNRGAAVIKARGLQLGDVGGQRGHRPRQEPAARRRRPNDWVSAAVVSKGEYGVPAGLVFGYPCRTDGKGNFSVVEGLKLDAFGKAKFEATLKELLEERDAVKELIAEVKSPAQSAHINKEHRFSTSHSWCVFVVLGGLEMHAPPANRGPGARRAAGRAVAALGRRPSGGPCASRGRPNRSGGPWQPAGRPCFVVKIGDDAGADLALIERVSLALAGRGDGRRRRPGGRSRARRAWPGTSARHTPCSRRSTADLLPDIVAGLMRRAIRNACPSPPPRSRRRDGRTAPNSTTPAAPARPLCVAVCPTDCLAMAGGRPWMPRPADCISCSPACWCCPTDALAMTVPAEK